MGLEGREGGVGGRGQGVGGWVGGESGEVRVQAAHQLTSVLINAQTPHALYSQVLMKLTSKRDTATQARDQ